MIKQPARVARIVAAAITNEDPARHVSARPELSSPDALATARGEQRGRRTARPRDRSGQVNDNTSRAWREPVALRDFDPAHVSSGSSTDQTRENHSQGDYPGNSHHDRAFLVFGDSERLRLFVAQFFDPDSRRSRFDPAQTIRPDEQIR